MNTVVYPLDTDIFSCMAAQPQTPFDRAASEYIQMVARNHKPRKITQTELGRRAGIGASAIGNYWRGETSMTLGTFEKICEILEVDSGEAMKAIGRLQVALEQSDRE